jgi:4-hydroxy-tetrahydrodipicolinate synthase
VYRGVIVPLITPLDESGAVHRSSLHRLIDSIRRGVSALMPALSSGEGWKLSLGQWRDVVAYTVEHAQGLPVLAGIQLPDTRAVLERCVLARELGVDAIVVTTPFSKGLSQEAIYDHYQALREGTSLPLFIYNEAALSQNHIELDTLLRICRLTNVVGIKESSGSAEFTRALVASRCGVPVFQGWENLLIEAPGIDGCVMPLANLDPALCGAMLAAPTREKQAEINAVCEQYGLFKEDWYHGIKKELVRRGIIDSARVA